MARRGAPAALALALVAASLASGRAHAAAPAPAIENEACACVFEHLLLERLDATGVQGDAPSPSPASSAFLRSTGCAPARADARRRAACLAPACAELCAPDPRGAVAPRGRRPPPDPSAEDDARVTLCELCEAHAPRASSNHALRVDPLWGAWTYGWYASWLVFVAVDAVVAASRPQHSPEGVGGAPYYWGNHPAPADASDAPVILPDVVGPFDQPQAHPTPAYYLVDDLGTALGLSTVPAPPPAATLASAALAALAAAPGTRRRRRPDRRGVVSALLARSVRGGALVRRDDAPAMPLERLRAVLRRDRPGGGAPRGEADASGLSVRRGRVRHLSRGARARRGGRLGALGGV